jgi:hypothetical protein
LHFDALDMTRRLDAQPLRPAAATQTAESRTVPGSERREDIGAILQSYVPITGGAETTMTDLQTVASMSGRTPKPESKSPAIKAGQALPWSYLN